MHRAKQQVGNLFIPLERMPEAGHEKISLVQDQGALILRRWHSLTPLDAVMGAGFAIGFGTIMVFVLTFARNRTDISREVYLLATTVFAGGPCFIAVMGALIVMSQLVQGITPQNTILYWNGDLFSIQNTEVMKSSAKTLRVSSNRVNEVMPGSTHYYRIAQLLIRICDDTSADDVTDWVVLHTGSSHRRIKRLANRLGRALQIPVEDCLGQRSERLNADDLRELIGS